MQNAQATDLAIQYGRAKNLHQIFFSIIYQHSILSPKEFSEQIYLKSEKRITPNQISFASIEELREHCTVDNFNLHFQPYKNLRYADYISELSEIVLQSYETIILFSEDERTKKAIKRELEKIAKKDRKSSPNLNKTIKRSTRSDQLKENEENDLQPPGRDEIGGSE